MNRKRKIRHMRKNIMRIGKIIHEEKLNKDDEGKIIYPKKQWGYGIDILVNGHTICCGSDSKYGAYKGALFAAKWAMEQEPFMKEDSEE